MSVGVRDATVPAVPAPGAAVLRPYANVPGRAIEAGNARPGNTLRGVAEPNVTNVASGIQPDGIRRGEWPGVRVNP
jgi:hypothetical protein